MLFGQEALFLNLVVVIWSKGFLVPSYSQPISLTVQGLRAALPGVAARHLVTYQNGSHDIELQLDRPTLKTPPWKSPTLWATSARIWSRPRSLKW